MAPRLPPPTVSDLDRDYGLEVSAFEPHEGGFGSACWVVGGRWFIKVFREGPPQQLELLEGLRDRDLPVVAPRRTASGAPSATLRKSGVAYAVFPLVHGRPATDADWREMARAMRQLHGTGGVELPRTTIDEPCIVDLPARL